jgi:hypothetical protein
MKVAFAANPKATPVLKPEKENMSERRAAETKKRTAGREAAEARTTEVKAAIPRAQEAKLMQILQVKAKVTPSLHRPLPVNFSHGFRKHFEGGESREGGSICQKERQEIPRKRETNAKLCSDTKEDP